MALILASQSPRRKELLGLLHIPFGVQVSDIDETMDPARPAYDEVARVSLLKAKAIDRQAGDVVVAADTIVVLDGCVMGKPTSEEDAVRMLTRLSGGVHQVMTGVTVLTDKKSCTFTEVTDVCFRKLSQQEIARYVATGEPMDKAGSYGIQGGAALFVEKIQGDYFNVVGLPVCRLYQALKLCAPQLLEENS